MLSLKIIECIANSKIEQAIEDGQFDNLPGFGKPFEFDTMDLDPNWWIRRKMEIEQINQLRKSQWKDSP